MDNIIPFRPPLRRIARFNRRARYHLMTSPATGDRFEPSNPTPLSIAEATKALQFEREQFERTTGLRLDADGRIMVEEADGREGLLAPGSVHGKWPSLKDATSWRLASRAHRLTSLGRGSDSRREVQRTAEP